MCEKNVDLIGNVFDETVDESSFDSAMISTQLVTQFQLLNSNSTLYNMNSGGENLSLCSVCNQEQPTANFVEIFCKHRFCSRCAPMISRTQLCPQCANDFAGGSMTPCRSGSLFPEPRVEPVNSAGSSGNMFSVWRSPPKAVSKSDIQRSSMSSSALQRQLTMNEVGAQNVMSVGGMDLHLAGSDLFAGSVFSVPPHSMNNNVAWHGANAQFDFTLPKCTMCDGSYAIATVRCIQCNETLCDECVVAHYRMRVTREHNVVKIESLQAILPSPQSSFHSDRLKADNLLDGELCSTHDSPLILVCVSCSSLPICSSCISDHFKHHVLPFADLRSSLLALIVTTRHDQKNLEDALETVRRMSDRIDASVQSVMRELRSVINLHISALEERKRDLLRRVDTIRQTKIKSLKAQSERIGQRLVSLSETLKASFLALMEEGGYKSGRLDNGAEMALSSRDNDNQLQISLEALLALIWEPSVYLVPHEMDHIKFLPPDSSFLNRMRNLGEIDSGACASMSHIVGEGFRRAIRDRMCTIHVQTCDACGEPCSSGQPLFASVIGPDGQQIHVNVAEREGGLYSLSYCPVEEGNHILNVTIRGLSISGCPVVVYVRKGRNYSNVARSGPLFSFGSEGNEDGQFCRPWGICCDNSGRIIIADRSNNRIQVFDKDGNFLHKFGSPGSRPGQFDRPAGIAVNSLNEIVVADKDNHRIQIFNERGDFLLKFGERGRSTGLFNYPWGVAVNSYNQIAVCDTRNHRVQIFSPQGQYIRKCGFDTSLFFKNLDSPRGVCYLHDGQLIISDFNNHRLAIVSSRGSCDMKCFGSEGDAEGSFCRPQGVTTDNEGHILICDSRNNRVQVLTVDGFKCIATFGGNPGPKNSSSSGTSSNSPGIKVNTSPQQSSSSTGYGFPTLERPTDLCVSPEGLVYVVDFGASCIRVY